MTLNYETKVIINNMLDILESTHPAVQEYTPDTDDGEEVCLKFCDVYEYCITVKALMSGLIIPTITEPVIMQLSMVDAETESSLYSSDREYFVIQVNGEVVFRAMLPNPSMGEVPNVSVYSKGIWCEDLERIKQILC